MVEEGFWVIFVQAFVSADFAATVYDSILIDSLGFRTLLAHEILRENVWRLLALSILDIDGTFGKLQILCVEDVTLRLPFLYFG